MLLHISSTVSAHQTEAKMTIEYNVTSASNMDRDDSKIAYKQLFGESTQSHISVYSLRNNPFKVATVCLGLLAVLLLAGVIGQSVHYQNVELGRQNSLKAMSEEKEDLQQNLNAAQRQKRDLEANHNQLQLNYENLSKRKDQLVIDNGRISEETSKLKLSQSQLKTNNAALNKELEQLKAFKDQLQTNTSALSTAKNLLQKRYDSLLKQTNELQASYESTTKERNNLQNKFNNVTRARKQLQLSYNDLTAKAEKLQGTYNVSVSEKDKLASTHQNLTIVKDTLQASYDLVKKAENELRASHASLLQEKNELESSLKNVTTERDQLNVTNGNLTAERDQLLAKVNQLSSVIRVKKCPSGWMKFQNRCYYASSGKKSWASARDYCKTKDADLTTPKTQEETDFVNGLYSSDREIWIGLTDEEVEGKWKWVDGTPVTTLFWASDQPNSYGGRNQDCAEIWRRGSNRPEWNDEGCEYERNWVCEM